MTEFGHVDSRTDNITDLTFTEMESVNGGFVIVPFLIGLGKGIGYGVAIGAGLYGIAMAAHSIRN
ncbi:hypothetical protein SAMN05216361_3290 [Marisediminitalea aggregata]|uniref:Class IIb bacteriocin, lactobin A/cerein 7B family n=1 Tax=Marisediminitalea aggregata TaxID=634436 RepID=A0A1M5NMD8_9ALTE|nr:hypothetical protein [Marisediminitalea aggregata]MAH55331.1 hypothetical protein [Aestuariibacter sp.]BBO25894.1 hypothetical protein AltI4_02820 [Alteromonas sp. I4]SHG90711.1 hypothetical protein SAMN05216361_3290 [Marisediminitalea aggregata]|tara:strand:+ start:553 stop:747 length:195 start_codon:yes stop_codon:yes gene_type:complete